MGGILFASVFDMRALLPPSDHRHWRVKMQWQRWADRSGGQFPVIVAFGDSLTSGPGLGRDEAYPALLQRQITQEQRDYRVVNAGVTGDTTSEALRRFDGTLVPGTKIVILAIGVNDGLAVYPWHRRAQYRGDDRARAGARHPGTVVRMEAPPVGPGGLSYTIDFHRMYTRLAERYSVPLVPFFLTAIIGNDELEPRRHPPSERRRAPRHRRHDLAPLAPDALAALLSSPTGGDL